MSTNFPTSLDSLVNPTPTDTMSGVSHSAQHANANDAIEALEAKVGVDSSADTNSLDYKVARSARTDTANTFTQPQVITATSGTALRVTNTGSGNSLVVEDSANPDSSAVVVDANGRVVVGGTASVATGVGTPHIQLQGTSASPSMLGAINFANDTSFPSILLGKSRGSLGAVDVAVQSGDIPGAIYFLGSDGTSLIRAATITASIDGTPGTNDMPGRIIFSTTADGASTPTERVRIDSAGRVGFGSTTLTNAMVRSGAAVTGATTMRGVQQSGIVQSDVTAAAYNFTTTSSGVVDAAFTLPIFTHYYADQGTFGASATVTSQYGFFANSTLTGATNNYGFYGNIAAATGRWNFYAVGTADNYFAGNVGIGVTPTARNNTRLQIVDGIGFPATQVASSDANTLDDYEEGTWTPTITRDGVAPTGVTYSLQLGTYTKVGRVVTAHFTVTTSAVSTQGSGNFQMSGLPFAANSTATYRANGHCALSSTGILSNNPSGFYVTAGSTSAYLAKNGASDSASTIATTGGIFSGSITYEV